MHCFQLKLSYVKETSSLYVTILAAEGIIPKDNGVPRNPYAKIYLLPDRRWFFIYSIFFVDNCWNEIIKQSNWWRDKRTVARRKYWRVIVSQCLVNTVVRMRNRHFFCGMESSFSCLYLVPTNHFISEVSLVSIKILSPLHHLIVIVGLQCQWGLGITLEGIHILYSYKYWGLDIGPEITLNKLISVIRFLTNVKLRLSYNAARLLSVIMKTARDKYQ